MRKIPVLNNKTEIPLFWFQDTLIDQQHFRQDVSRVASQLAEHQYAINLCEDRYLFAVGFVAAALSQQTCLMPASRADKDIEILEQEYPDCYQLNDKLINNLLSQPADQQQVIEFEVSADHVVAILFTSGSTGKPNANPKRWDELVESARRVAKQFQFNATAQHTLVATVPPQHMYGFETTIIYPLVTGVCVHSSKPFFPEDIRQTIQNIQSPVILITTPIHLRACVKADINWPAIDFAISATAPLSVSLAQEAEAKMKTRVKEIYGCSEAGVIATRSTTQNEDWTLLEDYSFTEKFNGYYLVTPQYEEDILIPDQIEQIDNHHFRLMGRQSDLVKIAGKRGSLSDLKIKLCSINGVEDAILFMPDETSNENTRLAAFVVAPELDAKEIITRFSSQVDQAFIPRPLIKLEKLPYNETGKLPRKKLLELFNDLRHKHFLKDSA